MPLNEPDEDHNYANGYGVENDPYVYENGCLINHLGIKNTRNLSEAEANIVRFRISEVRENPIQGDFDLKHAQAIHKALFGDIYPWAGEVRTVDIAKGDTYFCRNQFIESAFATLHKELKAANYYKDLDLLALASSLSEYFHTINQIHPFREGNGRTQRELVGMLAERNGYAIDWGCITPQNMYCGKGKEESLAKQFVLNMKPTFRAVHIS